MAFNDLVQNAQQSTSLTLTSISSGNIVAGPTLLMSRVKAGTLGAHVVATAATSTITLTAVWEVSDDATTWDRVLDAAASVLFATGTVSAVTGQVSAPNAVNSKRYARCSCLVGVTTGGASDHFVVRYDYILDPGA